MELIIFDCDGVLVDSEAIYIDVELEFLARAGAHFERSAYVRTFMGLSLDEWRGRVHAEIVDRTGGPPADDLFDELDAHLLRAFEERLAPLPGARAAVSGLDLRRCVASSTSLRRLHWKLRHTGLLDLFAPHLFSAEMVARGKPAPDLFLHAAATLDADPGRCVVVEDSVNGVAAGRAAGMRVIGFTGGAHCLADHGAVLGATGAELIIDRFADLAPALARLDSA